VIVTTSIIGSNDDLRQLHDLRKNANWARAARRLSARGRATSSLHWVKADVKWQAQSKSAVAGEMSFACRRGLLHDIFHRVPRRQARFPTFPLYCSNGLPLEGSALGLEGPTLARIDGELQAVPERSLSDDTPCLEHRPDGSLYLTTFGAAREPQGGR
jgi:hypothetical protein